MTSPLFFLRRCFDLLVVTNQNTLPTTIESRPRVHCFHCGNDCNSGLYESQDRSFCCNGCLTVFELLTENGLAEFYNLEANAGPQISARIPNGKFAFLDEPLLRQR